MKADVLINAAKIYKIQDSQRALQNKFHTFAKRITNANPT